MEYKIDLSRNGIKVYIIEEMVKLVYDFIGTSLTQIYQIPIDEIHIDEQSGKYILLQQPLTSYK